MALVAKNNDENISKKLIEETKKEMKKTAKKKKVSNNKKTDKNETKEKYLVGVKNEMKKVSWPNFKTMSKYILATLLFCIFFGLFFYAIDILFAFIKGMFK